MTDEQASDARLADRGDAWDRADDMEWDIRSQEDDHDLLRQALHDRDRFQRERDYWREECIRLTGEALA